MIKVINVTVCLGLLIKVKKDKSIQSHDFDFLVLNQVYMGQNREFNFNRFLI